MENNFREEKKAINHILILVDSRLRMLLFERMIPLLSEKGYWYALGQAYTTCDWTDNLSIWEKKLFFCANRPHRQFLMSTAERKYLSSLPETVTIYRAMTIVEKESGEFGISWTLNKKVAEFFAYKYLRYAKYQDMEKTVHSLRVPKSQLIAYFNERKEKEIIYNHVTGEELPPIF